MFGGVEKIPIANTCDELVEMGFADYGDFATFLRIYETFSRFPAIILWELKESRTIGRNGLGKGDFKLVGGVWAPGIIVVDIDARFIGGVLKSFVPPEV